MADRLNVEPSKLLTTLKNTVFKGASDDEIVALVIVANQYRLSPILKELYAFPAKGGGIVPVVSIDGWLRIINDHPQMDGLETSYELDETGQPISCTATIWRKDRSRPVVVTEVLSECRRNTDPWKMPFRMLRHKAIIQCARVAFGFSGIMDEDEAGNIKVATATVVEKKPFTPPGAPNKPEPVDQLVLTDEPESNLEFLKRRVREDGLDMAKVSDWLNLNKFPVWDLVMEHEAGEILSLYQQLKKEAK